MNASAGMRVALVLDNPQRDLDGAALLASEVARRGMICHFVPASLRARELHSLAPDYALLYHLRRGSERLVSQLHQAGVRIGVLDNEGGIWPDLSTYTGLLVPSAEIREMITCVCAWGPRVAQHLVEEGWFRADQVVVTGVPRFDFHHDRWRTRDFGPRSPRILVNSNYSEGNPRFGGIDTVVNELTRAFGWSRERVDAIIATQRAAMAATIQMARQLASDFASAEVAIRPHPFEAPQPYVEACAGHPNLVVDGEGSIQAALARATVTIQRTSTTGIESCLAGVPALAPMWVPVVDAMPPVEAVSEQFADYEALRSSVGRWLEGTASPPAELEQRRAAVIQDWFFRIDGEAHKRVADAICRHLPPRRQVDEARCGLNLHGLDGTRRPLGEQLGRITRQRLGLSPEWSFRAMRTRGPGGWRETDQYFGVAEVERALARVAGCRRAAGEAQEDVTVSLARDRGDCLHGLKGQSVTVAPAELAARRSA